MYMYVGYIHLVQQPPHGTCNIHMDVSTTEFLQNIRLGLAICPPRNGIYSKYFVTAECFGALAQRTEMLVITVNFCRPAKIIRVTSNIAFKENVVPKYSTRAFGEEIL